MKRAMLKIDRKKNLKLFARNLSAVVFLLAVSYFNVHADSITGPCGPFDGQTFIPGGGLQQTVGSIIGFTSNNILLGQTIDINWDSHDAISCVNDIPCGDNTRKGGCDDVAPPFDTSYPQPYIATYNQTCIQPDGKGGQYSTRACVDVTVNWSWDGTCGCANGKSSSVSPDSAIFSSTPSRLCSSGVVNSFTHNLGSWSWNCGFDGIGTVKRTCGANETVNPSDNGVCGCANGSTFTDLATLNSAQRCANGTPTAPVLVGNIWTWQCLGSGSCLNASCQATYENTAEHCPDTNLNVNMGDATCTPTIVTGTNCDVAACCIGFDYCNADTLANPTASAPTGDLVLCGNSGAMSSGAVDAGGTWEWDCEKNPWPATCTAPGFVCTSNCSSKHIFNFNFDNWKEVQP